MTKDWQHVLLEEVASQVTVGWVGPMTHEYQNAGVPFLRSLNIRPFRIDVEDLRYITQDFHEQIGKSRLTPGDVVIVRTGAPGTAAVIPEWLTEANCSDLVIVRPGPELNPRYLAYYLNAAAQHQIAAETVGAVQQHFNVGSAKRLRMFLPSLLEQRAISGSLGALDDKIEANRQLNETLQATCRALFRSWFVDFDPVVAKSEGRRPPHLTDEVAALFPDRFEDSPLGPVPEGWRPSTIGEEVRVVGGSTPSTTVSEYWDDGVHHWITPKDLSLRPLPVVLETSRKITDGGLAKISSGLLPRGTVLLSSRAPIGYLAIAEVPLAVNQGFIAMACEGALTPHFVVQWCAANMDEIMARAGGTTFAEISKANFRPIPVAVPNGAALVAFQAVAESSYATIRAGLEESASLATLRDALLPRLLSGELRVRQAEQLVEEAV